MKVHELIAELAKHNADADIEINDFETVKDITGIYSLDGGTVTICVFTEEDVAAEDEHLDCLCVRDDLGADDLCDECGECGTYVDDSGTIRCKGHR